MNNSFCLKNSTLFSLTNRFNQFLHQTLVMKPKYACDYFTATSICSLSHSAYMYFVPHSLFSYFLCLHFISLHSLRMGIESSVSFVLPNYTEYNSGYLILCKLVLNEETFPSGFSVAHKEFLREEEPVSTLLFLRDSVIVL